AGRVEPGAAMGIVFTTMFALGVLLLEQTGASGVHLDVEHALFGNLESLIWIEGGAGWGALADPGALAGLPPELGRMALAVAVAGGAVALFWRPLVLATFDPGHAAAVGLPVGAISLGLTGLAALAAVTAFQAVGAILVIAMFICPAAAARLMTDSLKVQVALTLALAAGSAAAGFWAAGALPPLLGHAQAVSAAGMIAVVSGTALALAAAFGPRRHRAAAG
ncbi:MAG: metal ABC transporter permease, partial [Rhodobacteraceae bacterium]|nr:metal ABC transporter permease [Paracoccaceae bacterium]